MSGSPSGPFSLSGTLNLGCCQRLGVVAENVVERLFALHRLDTLYQQLPPASDVDEFLQQVLDVFAIRYQTHGLSVTDIPASGGAIITCNHPFGAIEGVILAQLLRRQRHDVRIMANHYLSRITELRELFIAVDPFSGAGARQRNLAPLRQAIKWVRQGGVLVIFPAGEVSHVNLRAGRITDPEWSATIGRMVKLARVPVVPFYVAGSNSRLFQLAGLLHPRLRTALLPRELTKKQDTLVDIHIGSAIPVDNLPLQSADNELIAYLRFRTYLLRETASSLQQKADHPVSRKKHSLQPVVHGFAAAKLADEIEDLPEQQLLLAQGSLRVYWARARQLDVVLHEIGRLREHTFRQVGEGTGHALDLDRFDEYYIHLFGWDAESRQVIGAYRLGLVDTIMARFGKRGLYTNTLYDYPSDFINQIQPAIELGRSFVRPEWQRNYASLLLLWKGIGHFVALHPRYRVLFGPVSISDEYHHLSLKLMVDYLQDHNFPRALAQLVKPRRRLPPNMGRAPRDIKLPRLGGFDSLCDLISVIESHQRSVPILLKQYLKMGGQVLGFNVDRAFNDCVDALLMVDLPATSSKVLSRYMGREQAAAYLHKQQQITSLKAG